MFHVGQKVVCIKEQRWFSQYGTPMDNPPVKGGVYTVREKIIEPPSGDLFLAFNETSDLDCFWAIFFRPVTDISVFKRMLAPREVEHV